MHTWRTRDAIVARACDDGIGRARVPHRMAYAPDDSNDVYVYTQTYISLYIHTHERLCGPCTLACANGCNGMHHTATGCTHMHVCRPRLGGGVPGLVTPPLPEGLIQLLRGPGGVQPEVSDPQLPLLGVCGYVG